MIQIKVTQERFNEVIDLDDSFHLSEVMIDRAYEYLCQFVINDTGEYVGPEEAIKLFKAGRVKRKEIGDYWMEFVKKAGDAFVNPPSAATSEEPS